jgi:hypothetical protein
MRNNRLRKPVRRQTRGDRRVTAPAAVGRQVRSGLSGDRVPVMSSNGRGMRITHCERFHTLITTTTALEVRSFELNPGLGAICPWLADVANRFDKYKFRSVKFRYVPQASTLAGTVCMAFDFDPNDDTPVTMSEATTYHDYAMTSIWQNIDLQLDLANGDMLPQKNTRPGLPGVELDLNMYDVGTLHVLTEGAAAGTLGYIEVIYTVDLYVHQTQNGVGGSVVATTGLAAGSLFGTNSVANVKSNLPGSATSANTFTFAAPFEGLIVVKLLGTVFAAETLVQTGTATYNLIGAKYPTAATSWVGYAAVRAEVGQTLILTCNATTVTSSTVSFARGAYNSY